MSHFYRLDNNVLNYSLRLNINFTINQYVHVFYTDNVVHHCLYKQKVLGI